MRRWAVSRLTFSTRQGAAKPSALVNKDSISIPISMWHQVVKHPPRGFVDNSQRVAHKPHRARLLHCIFRVKFHTE